MCVQSGEEFDVNKVAIVIDKLSQVIMCLFDKVDSLEKKMKELKQEWMKLKMLEEDVLLGQIALVTEKEIVKCILRDTDVQQTKYITINELESALDPAWILEMLAAVKTNIFISRTN